MNDLQNKLKIAQQQLITITLELQKILTKDLDSIKNTKCNSQSELLRDLIHVLNVAISILETMIFLQHKK